MTARVPGWMSVAVVLQGIVAALFFFFVDSILRIGVAFILSLFG